MRRLCPNARVNGNKNLSLIGSISKKPGVYLPDILYAGYPAEPHALGFDKIAEWNSFLIFTLRTIYLVVF